MSYIVVFEYTTGGFKGVRFSLDYNTKEEFERKSPQLMDGRFFIIGKDMSESEAQVLVSLTPEICYLTAAIEESSTKEGRIDIKRLDHELQRAKYFITQNRLYRYPRSIVASIEPFSFAEVRDDDTTDRGFLLTFVQEISNLFPDSSIGNLDTIIGNIMLVVEELYSSTA